MACVAGQKDVRRRRVRDANKRRNVTFDVLSPVSGIRERKTKDEEGLTPGMSTRSSELSPKKSCVV
jgi:hypothetical protein